MSRFPAFLMLGLCAVALPVRGAEPEDPNAAMAAKLRDQLRAVTLQLRTVQSNLAAAQAAQNASKADADAYKAKSESLAADLAKEKTESSAKIERLTGQYKESEAQIDLAKAQLQKWAAGYAKAVEVANAKETERAKLADENAVLKAKVRDHKAQNLALFTLANEILTRYEKFSVGEALKAREPFTGITRARLEQQVQDYRDKAEDLRASSKETAKKSATAPSAH